MGEEFCDTSGFRFAFDVQAGDGVAHLNAPRDNTSDGNTTDEVGVVEIGHEKGEGGVEVGRGRRNNRKNSVKKRGHSLGFDFRGDFPFPLQGRVALLGGSVDGGKVELGVGGVEFQKEIEDLIEDFFRIGVFPIDLIENNDGLGANGEGFSENEFSLGLGTFGSVDDEEYPVDHAEDTFDFSTEVGVAGGVDDVDADVFVFE